MKIKPITLCLLIAASSTLSHPIIANTKAATATATTSTQTVRRPTTLIQVYQQAIQSDPAFQKAQADWMAAKQANGIAWGTYLPNIAITGAYTKTKNKAYAAAASGWTPSSATGNTAFSTPAGFANSQYKSHSYSITATQQLFNFAAWKSISMASAQVKAATATYLAASESLIQRTLSAYFQVLQDYEALRFNEASQKALYQTLETNREQYKVGLLAITDVYNAEASYDQINAEEYALKAKLNTDLEQLRAITNHRYTSLYGIRGQLPLITPAPANIVAWTRIATKQSYLLQAKIYATQAAKDNIGIKAGAWLPAISASAAYSGGNTLGAAKDSTSTAYAVNLAYTPFAGGANFANTKQARYQYLSASADEQTTYRSVISSTRQAYLGITSGKQSILADKKAIESAKLSLEATKAGYKVGTRTMVNILDSTKSLYQQKKKYADDQYTYLSNLVLLKQAAGTLSYNDVAQINNWLKQPTNLLKKINIKRNKSTRSNRKKTSKKQSALSTRTKKQIARSKNKQTRPTRAIKRKSSSSVIAKTQSQYRIQLLASKNRSQTEAYKRGLPKNDKISIIYHKPWYKIVYGRYQNRQQAKQALASLQPTLHAKKAWIYRTHSPNS